MSDLPNDVRVTDVELRNPLDVRFFELRLTTNLPPSREWQDEFARHYSGSHDFEVRWMLFDIPYQQLDLASGWTRQIKEAIEETNRITALGTEAGAEAAKAEALVEFREVLLPDQGVGRASRQW